MRVANRCYIPRKVDIGGRPMSHHFVISLHSLVLGHGHTDQILILAGVAIQRKNNKPPNISSVKSAEAVSLTDRWAGSLQQVCWMVAMQRELKMRRTCERVQTGWEE